MRSTGMANSQSNLGYSKNILLLLPYFIIDINIGISLLLGLPCGSDEPDGGRYSLRIFIVGDGQLGASAGA